jgi:hypothetical protein
MRRLEAFCILACLNICAMCLSFGLLVCAKWGGFVETADDRTAMVMLYIISLYIGMIISLISSISAGFRLRAVHQRPLRLHAFLIFFVAIVFAAQIVLCHAGVY